MAEDVPAAQERSLILMRELELLDRSAVGVPVVTVTPRQVEMTTHHVVAAAEVLSTHQQVWTEEDAVPRVRQH